MTGAATAESFDLCGRPRRLREPPPPHARAPRACAAIAAALALGAQLAPAAARAQPVPSATVAPTPGAPLTSPDDAVAVDANPAALAFQDDWSAHFTHIEGASGAAAARDADALRLATPLLWGTAVGVSVASIRPETGDASRGTGSLAIAARATDSLAFGTALRITGSADPLLRGQFGWDLAATWRPARTLAATLHARNVSGPLDLGNATGARTPASFLLSAGIRPTGTDALTFDVGGGVDSRGRVGARGLLLARAPYIGRVFIGGELVRLDTAPLWMAEAGLSVDWGAVSAGGGVLAGEGQRTLGAFATAAMGGATRDGLPTRRAVLDLTVTSAGPRSVLALLVTLDRAARSDAVAGVLVRFRDSGLGTAHASELREAFAALRKAGKPVACHLDAATGPEFFACAAATHTYLDPGGGVMLTGPSSTGLYFGEALEALGVRTEFVRIGAFKGAPEQYTSRGASPAAREARDAFYDDVRDTLTEGMARDLRTTPERVAALIDHGPYLSGELAARRLVRGEADERDMEPALEAAFGAGLSRVEALDRGLRSPWHPGRRVGVVVVDGEIVDGENLDVPVLGIQASGGATIADTLDAFAADPTIGAIVLRVDSPGGSVLASDQMWRAVMRARAKKPVVASMGAVAASGGYYIASAAHEIFAEDATLTGSIGVFYGKADVAGLAEKLRVGLETTARGAHAGIDSLYRPWTEEERAVAAEKVELFYANFLRRIEAGRGMTPAETDKVARGRVWSGRAALTHRLVDRLGGFSSALARARALADIDPETDVVFAPSRPTTLLDFVLLELGLARAAQGSAPTDPGAGLPRDLRAVGGLVAALARLRAGVGLARMEDVVVGAP